MSTLACFVSSHGFGHATRASAVLAALRARRPEVALHGFTEVPASVFTESVPGGVTLHRAWTDVGVVQRGPFAEDLGATVEALGAHLPFKAELLTALAAEVRATGASAVLCDISPLGIAVAEVAGLPSILLENFTWDWIYRGYLEREPRLARFADLLEGWFAKATVHLQAAPICEVRPGAVALAPICRRPRSTRAEIRARLGVGEQQQLVLLTLGGVPWSFAGGDGDADGKRNGNGSDPAALGGALLLVPGREEAQRGAVRWLDSTRWYHPDLVHAVDAVVGKVGYSTLAEVLSAGVPFGYLPRAGFRESPVLERFITERMPSIAIDPTALVGGGLRAVLPELLRLGRVEQKREQTSGAERAAEVLLRLL